jgi:hypothetical protein
LKTKLTNRNIFVYDYSDPGAIESSDCEFIDGFHGGDVTFSRILDRLGKNNSILGKYIDNNQLRYSISQYEGYAFTPNLSIIGNAEIDFNKLGCSK